MQVQQPLQAKQSQLQFSKSNLLKSFMNSSNPMGLIQSIASQNPTLKNVMSLFNSSGMSPKQFFYQYANSQGVNPDQFVNSLMNDN